MAIDVNDPDYGLGKKATYVTVNGVKYAIVRVDAWFDQIGSGNAPAPRGKSLSGRNEGRWQTLRRENRQARPQP